MNATEYARLLLDNSQKEGDRFWTRHNGFSVVEGILVGFVAQSLFRSDGPQEPILAVAIAGMLVAILHFLVLRVSAHYNRTWFYNLKDWVSKTANAETRSEGQEISLGVWQHFTQHLTQHEKLPCPKLHSSTIAYFIPILFFVLWIVIIILLPTSTARGY
jgi:hypothetical protein